MKFDKFGKLTGPLKFGLSSSVVDKLLSHKLTGKGVLKNPLGNSFAAMSALNTPIEDIDPMSKWLKAQNRMVSDPLHSLKQPISSTLWASSIKQPISSPLDSLKQPIASTLWASSIKQAISSPLDRIRQPIASGLFSSRITQGISSGYSDTLKRSMRENSLFSNSFAKYYQAASLPSAKDPLFSSLFEKAIPDKDTLLQNFYESPSYLSSVTSRLQDFTSHVSEEDFQLSDDEMVSYDGEEFTIDEIGEEIEEVLEEYLPTGDSDFVSSQTQEAMLTDLRKKEGSERKIREIALKWISPLCQDSCRI